MEQAKTEPKPEKPIEKAAPKKVVKKEEAPKPKPKPETKPENKFDPTKIAAEVKTAEDERAASLYGAVHMEARPSKTYADRQSAVLNRDPMRARRPANGTRRSPGVQPVPCRIKPWAFRTRAGP